MENERARIDSQLAAVAEGLRWDREHAADEATKLIVSAALTMIEGCRIAVAQAEDGRTVARHLRSLHDVLSRMDEAVAHHSDKLPHRIGSDAIH